VGGLSLRNFTSFAGGLIALAGAAVALAPHAAVAQTPARLDLAVGQTDFIRNVVSAADFRADYRSGLSLLPFAERIFTLQPFIGIEGTSKGSFWGGAGFELDANWGHWFISPTIAVGAFDRGSGKNLGGTLEFRTTAEGGWQFDTGMRLGLLFSHTSNANIYDRNPGTEALLVSVQVPLGALLGD
jgi:hypothetical protein